MSDSPCLPACSYRRMARCGPGFPPHYVCGCSGGIPIGTVGEESSLLAETCGPCDIPPELSPVRRRCLFLVPVRLWEGGSLHTGFSCRWFYALKPESLPGEVWQVCLGCPHWFPRPENEADIPGMDAWIFRVLQAYREPEPVTVSSWKTRPVDVPSTWAESAMERIGRWMEVLFPDGGVTRRFRKGHDTR